VDQVRNSGKIALKGVGVIVNFRQMENLTESILTVLEEPSYSQKAQQISKVFQDKPRSALDEAIWWIEFVIRNPSGPQYDSPSLKIGWFAANSYDVMLTMFIILFALIYIFIKIVIKICGSSEKKKLKRN